MPAKVSENIAPDGDGGVGERRRGREPVGRADVGADRGGGQGAAAGAGEGEDDAISPAVATTSAEPRCPARPALVGDLDRASPYIALARTAPEDRAATCATV